MLKEGELITRRKQGVTKESAQKSGHVWVCVNCMCGCAMAVTGDQEGEIAMEKMQKTVQLIKADEEDEEDSDNQRDKIDQQ